MTTLRNEAPILATWTGDGLELEDGTCIGADDRPVLPGPYVAYLIGSPLASLEAIMQPGDVLKRGRNSEPTVARLRMKAKRGRRSILTVCTPHAWDLDPRDTAIARSKLDTLVSELATVGQSWGGSAATVAGRLGRSVADGIGPRSKGGMGALESRWRALAHAAVNPGPMVACVGSLSHAVSVDRKKAFLRALDTRVPIGTPVAIPRDTPWKRLRFMDGIIHADVQIERRAGIPPLVEGHDRGVSLLPTGLVRGSWTIALVRQACRLWGGRVVRIHEGMVWPSTAACHSPVRRRIQDWPSTLRRCVYTRYWGRLAGVGGYEGTTVQVHHTDERWKGSDLWWRWTGIQETEHRAPPDYRPDHAAFIAASNTAEMNRQLASLGPLAIGAHVDCIRTTEQGAASVMERDPDGWAVKGSGPLRQYASALYVLNGDVTATGQVPGSLTPDELQAIAREDGRVRHTRDWFPGPPAYHEDALSVPLHRKQPVGASPSWSVHDPCWTHKGWMKDDYIN